MRQFINKAGWLLVTAFFLLIAWATSIEENSSFADLPIVAEAGNTSIILSNISEGPLDSLNLVLNGIYAVQDIDLEPMGQVQLDYSIFQDKNGDNLPADEIPELLEIYYPKNHDEPPFYYYYNNYLRLDLQP